mmetsp:Transcript_776/g.3202  ORF Transcript_776/g.3202 Transcript_776/m.3202 type:complete len:259 (-) Transcript_776:50-826(-)
MATTSDASTPSNPHHLYISGSSSSLSFSNQHSRAWRTQSSLSMNGFRKLMSKTRLEATLEAASMALALRSSRCAREPYTTTAPVAASIKSSVTAMASHALGCTMSYEGIAPSMVTTTKPVGMPVSSTCTLLTSRPRFVSLRITSRPSSSSPTRLTTVGDRPSSFRWHATFAGAPPRNKPCGSESHSASPMTVTRSSDAAAVGATARRDATPRWRRVEPRAPGGEVPRRIARRAARAREGNACADAAGAVAASIACVCG